MISAVPLFHHIDLRVMWSDTDPAGIVWFGVFFRYFEHAEEDLYRRLGSDRTALLRRLNVFMPRTSLQSGFRSPARLGDEIAVGVGVSAITDRRIGFAFDIHERGSGRLICEASYRVACVDATTFATRAFPEEVVALLAAARSGPLDHGPTTTADAGPGLTAPSPRKRSAFPRSSTPRRTSSIATSPKGAARSVAIECGDARITYDEVQRHVNRCGNALRGIGVRPEDRVLLLLLDGPEFVYSFFGAIKIGAVPVPLNTLWKPADYQYVIRDSRAAVLIVSAELLPASSSIPDAERRSLRHIIVVGGGDGAAASGVRRCSSRRDRRSSRPSRPAATRRRSGSIRRAAPARRKAACTCSTTWSSAPSCSAKACSASRAADRTLQRRQAVLRLRSRQRAVFSVRGRRDDDPLARAADAGERLRGDREAQADAVLLGADRLRHAARAPGRSRVEASAIARRGPRSDFDLSSIRLAVSAGEALPAALYERFKQRFGVDIIDGIGSTETLHMFISNRPDAIRPGSSGLLVRRLRGAPARRRRRGRCCPARSATCGSAATRSAPATGTSTRRPRTRSKGTGSAPATSTRRTWTASTGTPAAATTCSRSAACG